MAYASTCPSPGSAFRNGRSVLLFVSEAQAYQASWKLAVIASAAAAVACVPDRRTAAQFPTTACPAPTPDPKLRAGSPEIWRLPHSRFVSRWRIAEFEKIAHRTGIVA